MIRPEVAVPCPDCMAAPPQPCRDDEDYTDLERLILAKLTSWRADRHAFISHRFHIYRVSPFFGSSRHEHLCAAGGL